MEVGVSDGASVLVAVSVGVNNGVGVKAGGKSWHAESKIARLTQTNLSAEALSVFIFSAGKPPFNQTLLNHSIDLFVHVELQIIMAAGILAA